MKKKRQTEARGKLIWRFWLCRVGIDCVRHCGSWMIHEACERENLADAFLDL
jgi:hypothetical protein